MVEVAGWIAPVATMIAAMMTAANLGSRVTGWGFVVFLMGAVAWSIVAIATNQSNLLWSNVFLGLVDVIGIWRWLGRRAALDDGAAKAIAASDRKGVPTLFPITARSGTGPAQPSHTARAPWRKAAAGGSPISSLMKALSPTWAAATSR
jgi:hypothetical protein